MKFLKRNYTISCDRRMKKWVTLCKLRSQEKLDQVFSRKPYTISHDRKFQKWASFSNCDSKKNYEIFKKNIQVFLAIVI